MGLLDWFFGRPVEYSRQDGSATLQEAGVNGGFNYTDPDANLTAAQGGSAFFRKLTAGKRDLPEIDHNRMLTLAYQLFDTNYLAKASVELVADFILGEDVAVQAEGEETDQGRKEIQAVLDKFWDDSINKMSLKLPMKVQELGVYGEQCYPAFVNPRNGRVRLGYIDPAAIADVITHPQNSEVPVAIVVGTRGAEQLRYKIIGPDENPLSEWYGRLRGADTDEYGKVIETWQDTNAEGQPIGDPKPYAGSCFFFKINSVSNAKRGRSDLLPVIDLIDGYDQFLFGELDRALLIKMFIWDTTLTGMSEDQIAKYALTQPQPKPGTEYFHNEKVIRQAVQPDLKTHDARNDSDLLISAISTGVRVPKTWLNGMMDVNRATAQEMDEPTIKRLTARQKYVKELIFHLLTYALDQAEIAGVLNRREGSFDEFEPWPIAVSLPEMKSKDLSAAATSLQSIANALVTLHADHVIDSMVAMQTVVNMLALLGVEVDMNEMIARIDKEKQEAERKQQELLGTFGRTSTNPNVNDAKATSNNQNNTDTTDNTTDTLREAVDKAIADMSDLLRARG